MSCAVLAIREVATTRYHAVAHAHARRTIAADPDAVDQLGDEIATLSAHIHAATHRLLVLIAEFDRLRGWEQAGQRSCAHWLTVRTGIDLGAAREKVRAARALERLPLTSAAMSRGELSFSQVRALSRAAQPETEAALLELARGATVAQLERMVRAWKKGSRIDEAAAARECYESRTLSVFPDDDGMYAVRGRLTPELGALLMRAIEAASDALYREHQPASSPAERERAAAQRRADAIGLLAERALAAGFGSAETISGTRAQRYQVIVHVDPSTLSAGTGIEPGRAELEDGTDLSAETCRRLACDASIVNVAHDRDGSVLDVGRRTRTVPPALRRALDVRDRGCRFPGCGLRFTDAHHVRHWADGGETSLSNCLLLCTYHHTLVHERGWRVEWWGRARPVFFDPRGQAHFDGSWQPPQLGPEPVTALLDEHRHLGVEPDEWTAGARWHRERDIPAGTYFRASEAE
ncbi:MAG TPA: DUF222 domain-containing protein [Longimicrobiales bacterium]|nr:DUF222 domain-containing protein [Longimicrobiales bacterium]